MNTFIAKQIVGSHKELEKLYNHNKKIEAIVAGGAPRDWNHGFGARDIDIFYRGDLSKYLSKLKGVKELNKMHYVYSDDDIESVHEYQSNVKELHGIKVQFVKITAHPIDHVYDFPFGLSQALLTINGEIIYTQAYESSKASKCFKALRPHDGNIRYVSKLLGRFPKYSYTPYRANDDLL